MPLGGRLLSILTALVICGISTGTAMAAPGDLDPSFGNGGKSIVDLGAAEFPLDGLLQPDGKIIVSGFRAAGTDVDTFAARLLNPQGTPGHRLRGRLRMVAAQLRPRVSTRGRPGPAARRQDHRRRDHGPRSPRASGSRSPGCSTRRAPSTRRRSPRTRRVSGHQVLEPLANEPNFGNALALQGGSIIVAGSVEFSSGEDFAATRVTSDGAQDFGFGTDGAGGAFVNFGGDDSARGRGRAARQQDRARGTAGDGNIGGGTPAAQRNPRQLLRRRRKGHGPGRGQRNAVVLQPDGKIVVAGEIVPDSPAMAVVRLRPDGSLDPSFAGDGRSAVDFGTPAGSAFDVALQPDGKLLVAGAAGDGPGNNDFAVARLQPNGLLDDTFGGGGKVRLQAAASEAASAVLVQPDGKIVLTGNSAAGPGQISDIALARLQGDPGGYVAASARQEGDGHRHQRQEQAEGNQEEGRDLGWWRQGHRQGAEGQRPDLWRQGPRQADRRPGQGHDAW